MIKPTKNPLGFDLTNDLKIMVVNHAKFNIIVLIAFISFLFSSMPVIATDMTLSPNADSYLKQTLPNTNFGAGTTIESSLDVGTNPERIVLNFTLPSNLSNSTVQTATLRLYLNSKGSPSATQRMLFYRFLGSWSESVITWNNQPAHVMTSEASVTYSTTGAYYYIDITDMARNWSSNASGNFGILGVADSGTDTNFVFDSKESATAAFRPELNLTYGFNVVNLTMNQASGNYANDSSIFNNNGTIISTVSGTVTWATNLNNGSVNGTALSFGGTTGFVNISNSDSINFTTGSFSASVWVKPTKLTGSPYIFGKEDTNFYELLLSGGAPSFRLKSGGDVSATSSAALANNTFYYIYVEANRTSRTSSVYVNDVLAGSADISTIGDVGNNKGLGIGSFSNVTPSASFSWGGVIDEFKMYNYTLNSSQRTIEFQRFQPVPAYPVGGLEVTAAYPPLQTSVDFVWYDTVYPADEIQIAQDSNFNIMVADQFYSTDSASIGLNAGTTYFWRIKQYNPTTGLFGNTSATQTFSISSAPTVPASGSSIQGIVYEIINGVQTPISGSIVYLSNSTSSATFTTSSNGYFLFQNLASNSTYTIYATNAPIYNPSTATFVTTPTTASTTTNNILLTRFFSPFVPNYVYEKFIVRDLFDNKFSGVTVNIFEDGNVVATATATTDSMGQAVFQLIKNTYYRAEFSGGGLPNTITQYFFAKEEEYEVIVLTGTPSRNVTTQNVNATLDHSAFNATYENLTLYYNDASLTTTQVNFVAYNTTTGTFVLVCSNNFINTNVVQVGCQVPKSGNIYSWGYNATNQFGYSTGYITLSTPATINTTLSATVLNWIAIILLVILVSMFSKRNVKQGAIIVPVVAFILSLPPLGWLQVNSLYPGICLVLGVLYYSRRKEVENQL